MSADVRDLDKEGVMGYIALDKAWSNPAPTFRSRNRSSRYKQKTKN
jgi:hypothetical protein